MMRVDHPAKGQRRIVDEVVFERAADGDRSFDERKIGLLHRLRGKLGAQVREGLGGAGDEDESRGVRVNAVEGTRHQRSVPQRTAFGVTRDDGVHERARFAA